MRGYVINLARSVKRRVHVTGELAKTGIEYEFVDAVDGRLLDLTDEKLIDQAVIGTIWFRPGVAGCAFSHLNAYERILACGTDAALVLEDDVVLPNDLGRLCDELSGQLSGAEVILLNYDSPQGLRMSREGLVRLAASRQLALPIDVSEPASSAAYLITREACRRMVENARPFKARPDNWGHFYAEGMLDRIRCVVPLPVLKEPRFDSDIDYNKPGGLKSKLVKMVTDYEIKPALDLLAYRRRRIWRKQIRVEFVNEPFVVRPTRLD
ncbi:MAG: hypothetical protein JWM19_4333 [Actinomycetia bacterium]|nr:hypothetical protein [Actinomycetes bacterium]